MVKYFYNEALLLLFFKVELQIFIFSLPCTTAQYQETCFNKIHLKTNLKKPAKMKDYPLCNTGKILDFIAEANPAFLGSLATLPGRKTKLSTTNIRDWKTLEPGINRILRAQGNRSQTSKSS